MRLPFVCLALIAGCATAPDRSPLDPRRADTIVTRMENEIAATLIEEGFDEIERRYPEFALRSGTANAAWDPIIDPLETSTSIRSLSRQLENSVDPSALEPRVRRDIAHLQFGASRAGDSPVMSIDPVSGPQVALVRTLLHEQPADSERELTVWLERLATLGNRTSDVLAVARTRGARVVDPAGIEKQCLALRSGEPFTRGPPSVLRAHFQTQLHRARLPPDTARSLLSRADELIEQALDAVCRQVQDFVSKPSAAPEVDYVSRLHGAATRAVDPDQLHAEARRLLDNLVATNGPGAAMPPPADGQSVLNQASSLVFDIDEALPEFLSIPPEVDLDIALAPAFMDVARSGGGQYVAGASLGTTYLHLADLANLGLEASVRRFALPGHHAIPRSRIATLVPVPAFDRGWALYAAAESGAADSYIALEAARALIDTGIHAMGWSVAEALSRLDGVPGVSGELAHAMVSRVQALPGDGPAALVGFQALKALRERAEQRLGDRFDAPAFHAAMLAEGPRPLDVLERQINAWIEKVEGQ